MKKLYSLFVVILVLFSLTRCDKGMRAYDTTLTVMPSFQEVSGGDSLPDVGWKAFYFYHTDTLTYYVKSLEDAQSGLFRHKYAATGTTAASHTSNPAEISMQSEEEEWVIFRNISAPSAYLLIVHPEREVYAYRQMDFTDGLDQMWLKLPFLMWSTTNSVITNKWTVILKDGGADNPGGDGGEEEDKGYPAYQITTKELRQATPTEDDPEPKDTEIPLRYCQGYYVLVGSVDEFSVTSYRNVVDSVLTRDGVEVKLDEDAYFGVPPENSDQVRFTNLPYSWVFMVVYSERNEFYAYRYFMAQRGIPEITGTLSVPFYRVGQTYYDEEGGWTVVIPSEEELETPDPEQ